MSPRAFLLIKQESWDGNDPQAFYKLLVLKILLAIGALGTLAPLSVSIFVRHQLDHTFVLQALMWLLFSIGYLTVQHERQVFRASFVIMNTLTVLLMTLLISSGIGDVSGAYHHVMPILVATSFLLGPLVTLPYVLLFLGFYLAIATGTWHNFFPNTIAPLHPNRISLYVDRSMEIIFAYMLAIMFNRVKLIQQMRIKEQEQAAAKTEKQVSINRMAGGIAHEINNPLAILLGYLELLEKHDFQKQEMDRINPRIQMAAKRIQFVVWSLKQLDQRREPGTGTALLQTALHDVELRIRDMHPNLRLAVADSEDIKVKLPIEDLQNILYTLLVNAAEALQDKAGAWVEITVATIHDRVLIEVWDNGNDVDIADLQKFVEPFFTTKLDRPGRGMGLTLAVVIIQQVGGSLVYRRDGVCTVASMSLPGFDLNMLKTS